MREYLDDYCECFYNRLRENAEKDNGQQAQNKKNDTAQMNVDGCC